MDEHERIIEAIQRDEIKALRAEVNRLKAQLGQPPLRRFGYAHTRRRMTGKEE